MARLERSRALWSPHHEELHVLLEASPASLRIACCVLGQCMCRCNPTQDQRQMALCMYV